MKERAYIGGAPGQAEEGSSAKGMARQWSITAIWAVIGFILPGGVIYGGMSPFGVGLVAAAGGPGHAAVSLLTAIGYIAAGDVSFPLRYIAALLAVSGIRWVLSGMNRVTGAPVFAPLVAFLATFTTGLAMAVTKGVDIYDILLVFTEGVTAAGFAYFCRVAMTVGEGRQAGLFTAGEQTAVILVSAVTLMALSSFLVGEISPGRILAVLAILLMARSGKEQGGGMAGIILGVVMGLGFPEQPYLAAAYAFGGLLSGVFSRYGRLAAGGGFLAAGILMALNLGNELTTIVGLYEMGGGCLLFLAAPPSVDRRINRFFNRARSVPAVEGLRRSVVMRLEHTARAMGEVADTVTEVSKKLAAVHPPEPDSFYRQVSREICRSCGLCGFCWNEHYGDTLEAFRAMTPFLQEQGRIERGQFTGHLARHCSRAEALVQQINRDYMDYRVKAAAYARLSEIRSVVTEQFSSTSALLGELSREVAATGKVDEDAAARVTAVCEQHGLRVEDAVCFLTKTGRMTVEILAEDTRLRLDEAAWQEGMEDACGRVFDHPAVMRMGEHLKISLCEKPRYRIEVGASQLTCSGETLCGDAYEAFADGTGRQFVVLSDGMGSGGRAAVDGAMAAGLATRLIQSGVSADSVLRMVNTALMVKSEEESVATLDVAAIDLHTGRIESLKAGAAATLLKSMGRVSRMEQASMPIGILQEARFARGHDTLVKGDVLVVMSDGMVTDGIGWVEEYLREYDETKGGMSRLAEELTAEARRRQQGSHEDDITAITLMVHKAG